MAIVTASPWLLDGADNPLAPSSVIEELKEINPRLGLQYHIGLHAFIVTLQWTEDDPRREMIRTGKIDPNSDFEILCPVPTDLKLDELRSWLAGQLRRVGRTREDVRQMVKEEEERLEKHNAAVTEAKADEALEALISSIGEKTINVGKRRTRVK